MFQLLHDRYCILELGTHVLLHNLVLVNDLHRQMLVGFHVFSEFLVRSMESLLASDDP